MQLTDVVEKGSVTLKKKDNGYIVEYTDYDSYGTVKSVIFQAKSLRLAYMKLEEYLSVTLQY